MAITKEELNQLKTEYQILTTKLKELNEDEIQLVTGGTGDYPFHVVIECPNWQTCLYEEPTQCANHIGSNARAHFVCPKLNNENQ